MNTTRQENVLQKGSIIGSVHSVSAVIPMIGFLNTRQEIGPGNQIKAQVSSIAEKGRQVQPINVAEDPQSSHSTGDMMREVNEEGGGPGLGKENGKEEEKEITWDLAHLHGKQRELMEEILLDAKGVFSTSDVDIGNIPEFQMPIHLEDRVPVTEAY